MLSYALRIGNTVIYGDWCVNTPRPKDLDILKRAVDGECRVLQAVGDELDFIENQLVGIPITRIHNQPTIWRGHFAQFIFENLQYERPWDVSRYPV